MKLTLCVIISFLFWHILIPVAFFYLLFCLFIRFITWEPAGTGAPTWHVHKHDEGYRGHSHDIHH